MKKVKILTLITLLSVLLTTCLMGEKNISFGLKLGGHFTKFVGSDSSLFKYAENLEFSQGYFNGDDSGSIGGFLLINLTDQLIFRPEVVYSRKSVRYLFTQPRVFTVTINTDWIEIPLLLTYEPIKDLNIFAGPYYSFLLSGEAKVRNSSNNSLGEALSDAFWAILFPKKYKKEYEKVFEDKILDKEYISNDMGLILGASYRVWRNLRIEIQYALGLTSIVKKPIYGPEEDQFDIKTSSLQILASYTF